MANSQGVLEYKCPCCNAGLKFGEDVQKMVCEYCGNSFEIDAVKAFHDSMNAQDHSEIVIEDTPQESWNDEEQSHMRTFTCPSCAGELLTDENTAATFCPYCGNPTVLQSRVVGGVKPDALIPFQTSKEDAKKALLKLCKGKKLLPKMFTSEQHIEKLTGIYVPFWLYNCSGDYSGTYKATRIHHWTDSRYRYTRTEHFLLSRDAKADFCNIPMDGSQKMDDTTMESLEPFDFSKLVDFETAYLSGFFADKYDVDADQGHERVRQRVDETINDLLQPSFTGFASVVPANRQLKVSQGNAKYVLLPVWMLHTKYRDKTYVFAMNGQTGKMTGVFPICPKRSAAWFAGISAAVAAVVSLIQWVFL